MNKLALYFERQKFTEEDIATITAKFAPQEIKKGEFFLKDGAIAQQAAFLTEGIFRYYYDNDGDIVTTFIITENNFVGSISSFLAGIPSRENVQAITHSMLHVINKTDLYALIQAVPRFKEFYIAMLEYQVVCLDSARLDLLTMTSEERYLDLLEKQPEILQKIPLKLLASTLGITPRHLSRIRKKISTPSSL